MEKPSRREVLAVALLVHRRCAAAVTEAQHRCSELQDQVEFWKRAAESPRTMQARQPPPLLQLASPTEPCAHPTLPPPEPESLQHQVHMLTLWHQAMASLPAELRAVLAQAQRYMLLCELQRGGCGCCSLPVFALLDCSPVGAVLQLLADMLQAHAASAGTVEAACLSVTHSVPAGKGAAGTTAAVAPVALSLDHAQLMIAACDCLLYLCDHPGQAATDSDYAALQRFCCMVLQLALAKPVPPTQPVAVMPHQQPPQRSGPGSTPTCQEAKAQSIDLQQPTHVVAEQVLAALQNSPLAGIVLLSCAAPQTRDCMAALIAAITGEQLPSLAAAAGTADGFPDVLLGSDSHQSGNCVSTAGEAGEEARLLHTFQRLSDQLSVGLRMLPTWTNMLGFQGGFVEELYAAVMSARDASELISVTHPATARRMQQVAAQLVAALQLLSAQEQLEEQRANGYYNPP